MLPEVYNIKLRGKGVINMPQINFYTYLSQTTWTIIIFYIFYYCMKQYLLPRIFQNIKVKSLVLQNQTPSVRNTVTEAESKDLRSSNVFIKSYNVYNKLLFLQTTNKLKS